MLYFVIGIIVLAEAIIVSYIIIHWGRIEDKIDAIYAQQLRIGKIESESKVQSGVIHLTDKHEKDLADRLSRE